MKKADIIGGNIKCKEGKKMLKNQKIDSRFCGLSAASFLQAEADLKAYESFYARKRKITKNSGKPFIMKVKAVFPLPSSLLRRQAKKQKTAFEKAFAEAMKKAEATKAEKAKTEKTAKALQDFFDREYNRSLYFENKKLLHYPLFSSLYKASKKSFRLIFKKTSSFYGFRFRSSEAAEKLAFYNRLKAEEVQKTKLYAFDRFPSFRSSFADFSDLIKKAEKHYFHDLTEEEYEALEASEEAEAFTIFESLASIAFDATIASIEGSKKALEGLKANSEKDEGNFTFEKAKRKSPIFDGMESALFSMIEGKGFFEALYYISEGMIYYKQEGKKLSIDTEKSYKALKSAEKTEGLAKIAFVESFYDIGRLFEAWIQEGRSFTEKAEEAFYNAETKAEEKRFYSVFVRTAKKEGKKAFQKELLEAFPKHKNVEKRKEGKKETTVLNISLDAIIGSRSFPVFDEAREKAVSSVSFLRKSEASEDVKRLALELKVKALEAFEDKEAYMIIWKEAFVNGNDNQFIFDFCNENNVFASVQAVACIKTKIKKLLSEALQKEAEAAFPKPKKPKKYKPEKIFLFEYKGKKAFA